MFHIIGAILINLIAVFIVFIARLLGIDLFSKALRLLRTAPLFARSLFGIGTILVYTDCNDEQATTKSIAGRLRKELGEKNLKVRAVAVPSGADLTRWPLSEGAILGVILLVTDVTQLSARKRDRASIQKRLIHYVHQGGCLILGHDVIYRRSRNERLQKLAGGELDGFERVPGPVIYKKVEAGERATEVAELLAQLPNCMSLSDNEVVMGSWMKNVEFLYVWDDRPEIPLVTRRAIGDGRVYWINSGDSTRSGPPRSLARPQPELITLLSCLIQTV